MIQRPDLANDPELATNAQRVAVRPALLKRLGETIQHLEINDLCSKLEAAGLPYAKVVRPDQLTQDEHLIQSGGMVPMTADDGTLTQAVLLPLLMGGRRPGVRHPIASVGEHTEEVLAALRSSNLSSI